MVIVKNVGAIMLVLYSKGKTLGQVLVPYVHCFSVYSLSKAPLPTPEKVRTGLQKYDLWAQISLSIESLLVIKMNDLRSN